MGAFKEFECWIGDGAIKCGRCKEAQVETVRNAHGRRLSLGGKLNLDMEVILELYSIVADKEVRGPIIGDREMEVGREYVQRFMDRATHR